MVKSKNQLKKDIIKEINDFNRLNSNYKGITDYCWYHISDWDSKIVKKYKRLRKILKMNKNEFPIISEQLKCLPIFVWYRRNYWFEMFYVFSLIVCSFLYYRYIPINKGQISFWIFGIFFSYYFGRIKLVNKCETMDYAINDILKKLTIG